MAESNLSTLEQQCSNLEAENKSKDAKIAELMRALKDMQIKRAQDSYAAGLDGSLQELAEEMEAMKAGLAETGTVCNRLLDHLKATSACQGGGNLKSSNRDCQTQTSIHDGLEDMVNELKTKVNELQKSMTILTGTCIIEVQNVQQETFQDLVGKYYRSRDEAARQYEENQKLKRQLESQEETIFNQRGLIDAMTEAQEEISANLKEQLQVLQQQSITYSEDFENERRDREKVQSRVSDLEGELEATRTLLRQYESREMEAIHRRRVEALERYRRDYEATLGSVYQLDGSSAPHDLEGTGQDKVDSKNADQNTSQAVFSPSESTSCTN